MFSTAWDGALETVVGNLHPSRQSQDYGSITWSVLKSDSPYTLQKVDPAVRKLVLDVFAAYVFSMSAMSWSHVGFIFVRSVFICV